MCACDSQSALRYCCLFFYTTKRGQRERERKIDGKANERQRGGNEKERRIEERKMKEEGEILAALPVELDLGEDNRQPQINALNLLPLQITLHNTLDIKKLRKQGHKAVYDQNVVLVKNDATSAKHFGVVVFIIFYKNQFTKKIDQPGNRK